MRALITGGAGFIGSHLADLLVHEGYDVTVFDNLQSGRPQNLDAAIATGRCRLVLGDIRDMNAVDAAMAGQDVVFHLAALADIVPSIEQPATYFAVNVEGTMRVMEAARAHRVRRVVYAASSSCYGIPSHYPTPETAPIQPQYPYALTKRLGEEIALHWGQVYQIPVVSLRFFNVYGPRSRTSGTYGAVFGVFLAQKLANKPFTVVGDGEQTRDFTFVSDIARALLAAVQPQVPSGTICNVGSGLPQSVNHLVALLGGEVVHIPKRPGEPDCTHADIRRAAAVLGWVPQTDFASGVAHVVSQIDYWREAPVWDADSIAHATHSWFKHLEGSA